MGRKKAYHTVPIFKYALKNVAEIPVVTIRHISIDIPIAEEQKYSFRYLGTSKTMTIPEISKNLSFSSLQHQGKNNAFGARKF